MLYFWLVLLLVCIIVEFVTMGLTTIWFAGGALVAILATVLHAPPVLQVALFLAVAIALLIFTRPIAVKYFNKDRIRTNVESMIGKQAIVISEINNLEGIGQVTVGGQEWAARSKDETVEIPVGTVVIVCAINGVKLIVEPKV
ncbi:MAG: NfeD family protein [Lachnospiraceae bacterium]|nr:NfeD family protein [Lachnospiraceae bacterium]MBQ9135869.1 NfeD family protein [Lachnospiraceae bacterium]